MEKYEYESRWDINGNYDEKQYWFEVLLAGDKIKDAVTFAADLHDAIDNIECWYDDLEGWQLMDICGRGESKPYGCEVIY